MEIATATASAAAQTQNEVAVSVLRKVLDITAEQGAELAKMMDQASGVGRRVDLNA